MNIQMMEGLLGASSNIKLSGTSMSVYRQAAAEGDTEKMKRAMGYTVECTEKAVKYQEKLDKGMKAEAKAEREQAKLEQEAAIEKRREERKRAEEGAETGVPREPIRFRSARRQRRRLEVSRSRPWRWLTVIRSSIRSPARLPPRRSLHPWFRLSHKF